MSSRSLVGAIGLGIAVLIGSALGLMACSAGEPSTRIIRVPGDAASIAEAVERAAPGSIVSIAPGTYRESVTITVDDITVRGEDRNAVILDGGHRLGNGIAVAADGVAIENLTVHSYTQNGVLFNGIDAATDGEGAEPGITYGTGDDVLSGYRVSYVTAYNNGLYGVYAFAARDGLIEQTYVSGHPDSGVYVGQCRPCNVVMRALTVERNAIGYYGTNASGGVYVVDSVFRSNRLGLAPNSQRMENLFPQSETVIAGNLIVDNDDPATPEIPDGYFGGGIAIGGGTRNTVFRNRIEGHSRAGIELLTMNEFLPEGNRIEQNILGGNGVDLLYDPVGASGGAGNCFGGNRFTTSIPAEIELVMPCDRPSGPVAAEFLDLDTAPAGVDHRLMPAPAPQPTMPIEMMAVTGGAGPVPVIELERLAVPGP